jgi:predicted ATPase
MLQKLHLKQVGIAPEFNIEFAHRLNIFTGDNGLGKTFLLITYKPPNKFNNNSNDFYRDTIHFGRAGL